MRPFLEKPYHKKRTGRMARGVDSEFKLQYQKIKNKEIILGTPRIASSHLQVGGQPLEQIFPALSEGSRPADILMPDLQPAELQDGEFQLF
jgi:hypothetical protein